MRLWSLHPKYLDAKGLVALWREALLAQKVLMGETRGYRNHPQLLRFRQLEDPVAGIAAYLTEVHAEASRRGYAFDRSKIVQGIYPGHIKVTGGQLAYEWAHLLGKLQTRDPAKWLELKQIEMPAPHPLFVVAEGGMAPWEKI